VVATFARVVVTGVGHGRQGASTRFSLPTSSGPLKRLPRTHLSLRKDTPLGRAVQPYGNIAATQFCGVTLALRADMICAKDRWQFRGRRLNGATEFHLSSLAPAKLEAKK
jgi:hypothetical protein